MASFDLSMNELERTPSSFTQPRHSSLVFKVRSLPDFCGIDGANFEFFEKFGCIKFAGACGFGTGPDRHGAAVGMAGAEVV